VTEEKSVIIFPMDGAPEDRLLNDNHLGTARFEQMPVRASSTPSE
jgi:hypothetical protein